MRRRILIATLGGAVAAWPSVAWTQRRAVPVIGILVAGTPDPTAFLKEFRDGLRSFGYIEGQNIVLEVRSAGSTDPARLKASALELVRLKVDVIVSLQTPPSQAAKEATRDIPIVMAGVGDAIGTGLVASLARPGGNITGTTSGGAGYSAKNVELLRDLLPAIRRIGVLCNSSDPYSKPFLERIQEAAGQATGLDIRPVFARGAAELEAAFAELVKAKVDAAVLQPSLGSKGPAELALKHRMAAASANRQFAEAGGLLSYTSKQEEVWRAPAYFVDRILKGAKPADLPIQQPTTSELVINLKTAKALGITVPPALLARADEVIE
jgi:putative ABC transport system substrate-binding protein